MTPGVYSSRRWWLSLLQSRLAFLLFCVFILYFVLFCCIYSLRFLLCCKNNFNLLDSAELNWPDLQTSCQTWQAHDFVSCLAHETNEWTSFSLVEQKHCVLCRGHWFSAGGGQELRGQALLVDEGRNEWRNRPVLSPFGSGEHHVLTQRLNVWILCIPLNASHTVRKLKIAGWMKRFEALGVVWERHISPAVRFTVKGLKVCTTFFHATAITWGTLSRT